MLPWQSAKRSCCGPIFIRMAGGSFGLQAGGQGTDLVLVAMNEKGMQDILKDKFKIGGDAAAAAGPVGEISSFCFLFSDRGKSGSDRYG